MVIPTQRITVDDRVGAKELADELPLSIVARLPYGDFSWVGNGPDGSELEIGVERKTIPDLMDSLRSNRLVGHQLYGMLRYYNVVYLVIEGYVAVEKDHMKWFNMHTDYPMKYSEYYSRLLSICHQLGVTVVSTADRRTTVAWLWATYSWWTTRKWEEHESIKGAYVKRYWDIDEPSPVKRFAEEFDTIGPVLASRLEKRFKSILKLSMASVDDIMEVEGIGRKTASYIYDTIRREV